MKLLRKSQEAVIDGVVYPLHLQLVLSSTEPSLSEAQEIADTFKKYGTQAVTLILQDQIHAQFDSIVEHFIKNGIKVGCITNGTYPISNKNLSWLKINITKNTTIRNIVGLVANLPNIEIGINYNITTDSCVKFAMELVKMANQIKNISHIKFVTETSSPLLEHFKNTINGYKQKCVFINNTKIESGSGKCRVGYLRPYIKPNGRIQPCANCDGVLGHWREFPSIEVFDGSRCKRCHFTEDNRILGLLVKDMKHTEFI